MPLVDISVFAPSDAADLGRLLGAEHGVELDPQAVLDDLGQLPDPRHLGRDADGRATGAGSRQLIARVDGVLHARLLVWRIETAEPGAFASDVRIADGADPATVAELVRAQLGWLDEVGGRRLRTAVDDGRPEWTAALIAAGFAPEAHVVAGVRELTGDAPGPDPDGIELRSLAELTPEDRPRVERALHELIVETLADNPGHIDPVPPFDRWRRETLDDDDFRADWLLLAFRDAQLIGLSWAVTDDDPDAAYLEYTAVARSSRGAGIAGALKQRLTTRLHRDGIRGLATEWAVENEPIARLNRREGYTVVGGHRRLGVDVRDGGDGGDAVG